MSYVETVPAIFQPPSHTPPPLSLTLRSPLFTMLFSNLKALKFIRSFFVTERSRLSRTLPHRLLLSSVDPLLRLQGGNHPEIFRRSKNREPSVFWLFEFPFKSTAKRHIRFIDVARGFQIFDELHESCESDDVRRERTYRVCYMRHINILLTLPHFSTDLK